MAKVSHRITGLDGLRARFGALPGIAGRAAHMALLDIAKDITVEIRAHLAVSSHGGAGPADPTGRFAAATEINEDPHGGVEITVGLPYAAALEFGTTRMVARPFLRPAALQAAGAARAALGEAVRTALAKPEETKP